MRLGLKLRFGADPSRGAERGAGVGFQKSGAKLTSHFLPFNLTLTGVKSKAGRIAEFQGVMESKNGANPLKSHTSRSDEVGY